MPPRLHSLVIPVYKNEENIHDLLVALEGLAAKVEDLEVVLVVDGSPDRSMEILKAELPNCRFSSRLIAHSRNFGAFAAVKSGMAAAEGRSIAVMAADLQEPPDLIVKFFELLDTGKADVVFGRRTGRSDGRISARLSNLFWRIYRRFVLPEMPVGGVDVFACSRQVAETVLQLQDANTSLVSQLFWVGFEREFVPYERLERSKGGSSWSFRRRLRYMADSIFSFSDLPILVVLWSGIIGLGFSMLLGAVTLVGRIAGYIDQPGYATLVISVLAMFSILITSQGIIGMYLWRAFENSKGLPASIVTWRLEWPGSDRGQQDADDSQETPGARS